MATISRIEVPSDLKSAKVFVSILPFNKSKAGISLLKSQWGEIQQGLNKQLAMKFSPRITFVLDAQLEKVAELEALMDDDS